MNKTKVIEIATTLGDEVTTTTHFEFLLQLKRDMMTPRMMGIHISFLFDFFSGLGSPVHYYIYNTKFSK